MTPRAGSTQVDPDPGSRRRNGSNAPHLGHQSQLCHCQKAALVDDALEVAVASGPHLAVNLQSRQSEPIHDIPHWVNGNDDLGQRSHVTPAKFAVGDVMLTLDHQ